MKIPVPRNRRTYFALLDLEILVSMIIPVNQGPSVAEMDAENVAGIRPISVEERRKVTFLLFTFPNVCNETMYSTKEA